MNTKKRLRKHWKRALALIVAVLLIMVPLQGFASNMRDASNQANTAPSTYYTWVKLKSDENLQDVIKKYGKAYGDDASSIALPILLIDKSTGYLFGSPGEAGENTKSDDGSVWKQGKLYSQNTGSMDYWLVRTSILNMEGAGAAATGSAFVTGGLLNCWFVTSDSQTLVNKDDRSFTMSYQLHTWKTGKDARGNTTVRMSAKMLNDSYAKDRDVPTSAKFSVGSEAYTQNDGYPSGVYKTTALTRAGDSVKASCNWSIVSSGSGFQIRRYEIYYDEAINPLNPDYYYLYRHSLAGETSITWGDSGQKLFLHVGLEKVANSQQSGFYDAPISGYAQKSGTTETFDIWYAVEGVSLGLIDGVDGTATKSAQLTEQTMTMEVWSDNKVITGGMNNTVVSGTSAASPVHGIIYIPEGNTLTIEENAVFIVGRNSVLINNGTIVNNGTVIVQPGGVLMNYELNGNTDGSNVTAGIMTGRGDLYIRTGGKVRINELSIEGILRNSGLLIVVSRYVSGRIVQISSDLTYLGRDQYVFNYWFEGTDSAGERMTFYIKPNPDAVVEIRESTRFILDKNFKIHYPEGVKTSDVFTAR